jgi:hypothetical protein
VIRVDVERGQVVEAGACWASSTAGCAEPARRAEAIESQTMAKLGLVAGQSFEPARDAGGAAGAWSRSSAWELEYQRYERLAKQELVSHSDHGPQAERVSGARR